MENDTIAIRTEKPFNMIDFARAVCGIEPVEKVEEPETDEQIDMGY